jgi:hypothetical protein
MTTGAFVNISGLTYHMQLTLFDCDRSTGDAVWRAALGDEERFIEGTVNDDAWSLFDKACRAYDEEEK